MQSLHATISLGRPIVLFFFPLAGSPHCTLESCHFRDALAESAVFGDLDAIVIGVSQDSPEILRKFADTHDLGFIVLSDHNREAMEKFGVSRAWLGLINSESSSRAVLSCPLEAPTHRRYFSHPSPFQIEPRSSSIRMASCAGCAKVS